MNLLVNAADAIAEKDGSSGDLGTITLRTLTTELGVRIEVCDTGGGIPAHVKNRIFDQFFTTKDVGKGTGQGLAITYDIITKRHAGSIDVITGPSGTTFVIDLPKGEVAQVCVIDEDQFIMADLVPQ